MRATFENAKLYGGDFRDYNFSLSTFKNVEFQNSDFRETWFIKCNIVETDFTLSNFKDSYFTGSNIWDKTSFVCSFIANTRFNGCFIQGTDFTCSQIYANFDGTRINNCCFDGCLLNFPDMPTSFRAAYVNISTKGMGCIEPGVIARGSTEHDPSVDFYTMVKSRIDSSGVNKSRNKYEKFPSAKLLELEYLLNTDVLGKYYYHNIMNMKLAPYGNGMIYKDLSKLTEDDAKEIFKTYDDALKLIE